MVGMERGENLAERRYMERLSTMKRRMVVAMGWFLMALLLLPVGAMAQTTWDVKIRVRDGRNKLEDVTVTIVDANGITHTGANPNRSGFVTVPNVPMPIEEGTVTVRANGKVVTVRETGTAAPSVINFVYAKPVEVTVVDAVTGLGIKGATVTVGAQEVTT